MSLSNPVFRTPSSRRHEALVLWIMLCIERQATQKKGEISSVAPVVPTDTPVFPFDCLIPGIVIWIIQAVFLNLVRFVGVLDYSVGINFHIGHDR